MAMSTEDQHSKGPLNQINSAEFSSCPKCGAAMPREMRFCRSCGYRLGEGLSEFSETIRLPGATNQQGPAATNAPVTGGPLFNAANPQFEQWRNRKRRRRGHWVFWVLLSFGIASVAGGGLIRFGTGHRGSQTRVTAPKAEGGSFVGADRFETTPAGLSLGVVTPPGSAADKAGLVGGDVITSFDGKPVNSRDQLMHILSETPVGRTVEVVYLRDGEKKTTKLTTISEDENDGLREAFDDRDGGQGKIGVDSLDQVDVPGMKIKGVRIGRLEKNLPAKMAGVKEGDVVIEFGGTPIRTGEELRMRIRRTMPGSSVKIVVVRGTDKVEIPLMVGEA
jgi:hypothetical protein